MSGKNLTHLKIGVLMGGSSSEKEISLKSGQAIFNALIDSGINAVRIEINTEDESKILADIEREKIDIVFNVLHGRFGEDGDIQEIFERNNMCYIGSDAASSRLAFNKAECQKLFQNKGMLVPKFQIVTREKRDDTSVCENSIFPAFVKPAREGSSIGITRVEKSEEMANALDIAFSFDSTVLVDSAICGRELTVGILDNQALPIVEIQPRHDYFDFVAKYEKGQTAYIVPALLDEKLRESIQQTALKAYNLCGCRHFARVDFILDAANKFYILEVNTIPGFTETSLLPMAAQCNGINFNQLCLNLIGLAHGQEEKVSTITRH